MSEDKKIETLKNLKESQEKIANNIKQMALLLDSAALMLKTGNYELSIIYTEGAYKVKEVIDNELCNFITEFASHNAPEALAIASSLELRRCTAVFSVLKEFEDFVGMCVDTAESTLK